MGITLAKNFLSGNLSDKMTSDYRYDAGENFWNNPDMRRIPPTGTGWSEGAFLATSWMRLTVTTVTLIVLLKSECVTYDGRTD